MHIGLRTLGAKYTVGLASLCRLHIMVKTPRCTLLMQSQNEMRSVGLLYATKANPESVFAWCISNFFFDMFEFLFAPSFKNSK